MSQPPMILIIDAAWRGKNPWKRKPLEPHYLPHWTSYLVSGISGTEIS